MPIFTDCPEKMKHNTLPLRTKRMRHPDISYNLIREPIYIHTPKKAQYFSIVLFEKAKGYVRIDDELHLIGKGTVIVIFPGQCGSCKIQDGTIAHHLVATQDIYETISSISNLYVGKLKPISFFDLNNQDFSLLLHEFCEVKRLLELEECEESLIVNRFKTIYLMLKSLCMKERKYNFSDVNHPTILRFIKLIDLHYKKNREVAFYAGLLHIHPNYLNILCKKTLQITAKEVIKNRVVIEAKSLLMGSDLSVKEISYSIGIETAPHFTAFFKRETGFSPKEFLELRAKNFRN